MNYRVNDETLALIPNGYDSSQIIENNQNYIVNKTTFRVIEDSCAYFGVNYKSRLEGALKFINTKYKVPIIIQETNRLIFFPITSPTRGNTTWISFNNIENYYPCKNKRNTFVEFKNGFKMYFDISFYSFNQQYLKAAKLYSKIYEINYKK